MQASLHRAVLIHLMFGLGTPLSLAEQVKANFVVLLVLGVISETTAVLKLWLLCLFSPSEPKNFGFVVITYTTWGLLQKLS